MSLQFLFRFLAEVSLQYCLTAEQAKQMLDAGASLIQVYSGFIYNGPSFVKQINKYLAKNI
ncbi:MAG: hypothetical protein IJ296_01695 [Bacteroidales bacterium]|nr:hypothetical protein [Bacteroidales bacterium]